MTTKRRLTTDELVAKLLEEIRADREQAKIDRRSDREATEKRQKEITDRLDELGRALANLGGDFRTFQTHVLDHEKRAGENLRDLSNFVGMTNPVEKNGGR